MSEGGILNDAFHTTVGLSVVYSEGDISNDLFHITVSPSVVLSEEDISNTVLHIPFGIAVVFSNGYILNDAGHFTYYPLVVLSKGDFSNHVSRILINITMCLSRSSLCNRLFKSTIFRIGMCSNLIRTSFCQVRYSNASTMTYLKHVKKITIQTNHTSWSEHTPLQVTAFNLLHFKKPFL